MARAAHPPTPRRRPRERRALGGPRHAAVAFGAWRRRALARVPAGGLLALASLGLAAAALRAEAPAGGPEPTTAVVVATVDLGAGAVVDADDVEIRSLPTRAVAPGAPSAVDHVVGRQVTAPIVAGEPVLDVRLAPDGLRGVAASTPPGWSAFAIPVDATTPPVEVGQEVDLFAPAAGGPALAGATERVATRARVVAVDDRRVTVAVRPADGPGVAAGLAGTTVVLAVAGPPPG